MGKVLHLDDFRKEKEQAKERKPGERRAAFARARAGMLEFKPLRDRIRDEAKSLSAYFRGSGIRERPDDFELRIARVCLAMYLVEAVDRMASVTDRRRDLQGSFESARKSLRDLLSENYFSMSAESILGEYSKAEPALRNCASRCGIRLLDPEPAVEEFKMRLAGMIDEINDI